LIESNSPPFCLGKSLHLQANGFNLIAKGEKYYGACLLPSYENGKEAEIHKPLGKWEGLQMHLPESISVLLCERNGNYIKPQIIMK
jgi:hypothetical protein